MQHIEEQSGRLEGHAALYSWSADDKRTSSLLFSSWLAAVKDLGGLGWAYSDEVGDSPSPSMRQRLRSAILSALSTLGDAVPIDVSDLYNAGCLCRS